MTFARSWDRLQPHVAKTCQFSVTPCLCFSPSTFSSIFLICFCQRIFGILVHDDCLLFEGDFCLLLHISPFFEVHNPGSYDVCIQIFFLKDFSGLDSVVTEAIFMRTKEYIFFKFACMIALFQLHIYLYLFLSLS